VAAEIEHGVCPGCNAPLGPSLTPPRHDDRAPAPAVAPAPRRAVPFLLGLLAGSLLGAAGLWAAWRLGAPLPGGEVEEMPASQSESAKKTEADSKLRDSEAGRRAAETARAEAQKARDAAGRRAAALFKEKQDVEQRLQDALARLREERGRRAALEKAIAEVKKPRPAPTLSFVRDWQLLGPFASTGD
jgi:hypothetical protein